MRHLRLSVFSILAAALLGGPAVPLRVPTPPDDMLTKHKWDVIPDKWISLGNPPEETTIDLHIALQPDQKDALTDVLLQVSQPGHPKYGAHLSMEQVAELVAPHPNTLMLVTTWLEHNGVPTSSISRTLAGGWLTVIDVPVSQANKLLGASYQLYHHAGMDDTILRTAHYALPRALHVHVKTVVPTTAFTSSRFLQQTSGHHSDEAAAPNVTSGEPVNMLSPRQDEVIEPSVLRSMYHVAPYRPRPDLTNNRLGLVGYDDESPSPEDLKTFMNYFRSDGLYQILDIETIDRTVPVGRQSGWANMFTQYAAAMAFPIPITFYNGTGRPKYRKNPRPGPGQTDVVLQWLHYTIGRQDIPQTIGLMTEGTKEKGVSPDYAQTLCDQFKILGVTGVTVFVASGDDGVGSGKCREFFINFPASCPYVTAVGGTTGIPPSPEVAYSLSGGGFSYHFPAMDYQKTEVGNYIDSLEGKYEGRYPPAGRAVPDIALQSSRYTYVLRSRKLKMDSTVCSTSTAVGIFSLLNDYRIFQGLGPFGWINPWLYGAGSFGFNDITSGNNPGCGTEGFEAKDGWDPITGLGSPDVRQLLNILHPILQRPQPPQPPQPQRRNQSLHDQL